MPRGKGSLASHLPDSFDFNYEDEMINEYRVGRPSDYHPDFCNLLIEHMAQGLSFQSFSPKVNVVPSTCYRWLDAHPEFRDAKELGEALSRLRWEKLGICGMEGRVFNFREGAWKHFGAIQLGLGSTGEQGYKSTTNVLNVTVNGEQAELDDDIKSALEQTQKLINGQEEIKTIKEAKPIKLKSGTEETS